MYASGKPCSSAYSMPSLISENVLPSKRSGVWTVCPALTRSSANAVTPGVSPSAWWNSSTSAIAGPSLSEWSEERLLPLEGEQEQVDHVEPVRGTKEGAPGRIAHDRELAALHGPVERLGHDAGPHPVQPALVQLCLTQDVEPQRRVLDERRSLAGREAVERGPLLALPDLRC